MKCRNRLLWYDLSTQRSLSEIDQWLPEPADYWKPSDQNRKTFKLIWVTSLHKDSNKPSSDLSTRHPENTPAKESFPLGSSSRNDLSHSQALKSCTVGLQAYDSTTVLTISTRADATSLCRSLVIFGADLLIYQSAKSTLGTLIGFNSHVYTYIRTVIICSCNGQR